MPPLSSVRREERLKADANEKDDAEDGDPTEREDTEKSLDDIIDAYTG